MITLLIFTLIAVYLGIKTVIESYRPHFFEYILVPIFCGFIGSLLSIPVMLMLPMEMYKEKSVLQIASMKDNMGMNGSFFLGSGQIKDEMKYVFYVEENGTYKLEMVKYDYAVIKYTTSKPRVIVYQNMPTEAFYNYFGFDSECFDKHYVFEIPQGSIKNNFTLDAE